MMKNVSAVIVSNRTGRHLKTPVPLLPFGDTTILGRTLLAYLGAGFSEIVLVLSYRASDVQASLGPLAEKIQLATSADPDEEFGSLLRRGCEKISPASKAFAIGMGDQPLLTTELITELAHKFTAAKARILVPVCQGHVGFPSYFDMSVLPDFKKLNPRQEICDVLKARASEVVDCGVFETAVARHVDDLEDYHAMLRMAGLAIPQLPETAEDGNGTQPEPAQGTDPGILGQVRRVDSDS